MSKVIIIGGGAAGMMAAVAAAENGHSTLLLEKNEKLGKKLFITGKGRCNVTNACDTESLFQNVLTNPKFLYSAFYSYDNHRLMDFFEKAGCPLKTERGERVFPVSDHSSDIIKALERQLRVLSVEVALHTCVKALLWENTGEKKRIRGVRLQNGREEYADAIIVATGGLSYAGTGSDGDGYRFAEETSHKLTEPRPGLVPLEAEEDFCAELMGLSLKNVTVSLVHGNKEIYSGFGEMLFTHFGVSGPLILSAASHYVKKAWGERAALYIDLKPALSMEQLDKRLLRDFEENKNKAFKNALGGLFPARLIPVMLACSGIEDDKKINEITKEERKAFAELIKRFPLTITGTRGFAEAIITQGGVSVKDINPSTMESKLVDGLYFAGEVLDVDALTGGFNLQIAWSTGYLAGSSIAADL
ncbi:MAG: NAD(P)/FAD-dependent oxidoreductase [Lachnospiraceae bacterium]|nr:NAD(P)/FAD-dependent oxidoreductase [Lachnospiraceae bacterium]